VTGPLDKNDYCGSSVVLLQAMDVWAMGVTLYCFVYGKVCRRNMLYFRSIDLIGKQTLLFHN